MSREELVAVKLKVTAECPVGGKEVTLKHCVEECKRYSHIAYIGQVHITLYCKK